MSAEPPIGCSFISKLADGSHELCSQPALFSIPVDVLIKGQPATRPLMLCLDHMVQIEGRGLKQVQ
jgi:hypothetical protein